MQLRSGIAMAAALIHPLAWELLYAAGAALKGKERKKGREGGRKKERKKEGRRKEGSLFIFKLLSIYLGSSEYFGGHISIISLQYHFTS